MSLVAIVVLFTNLGGPRLWDRDEPRNAGCAAEMLGRGDWVTPVFDGELRTHKPILLYWLMMTAYAVWGINEFSARFWSAAMGVGAAWLTYAMARRLFSAQVGLWAAVILVTTLMFDVAARAATPDSALIFWTTAALFVYVCGTYPAVASDATLTGPVRLFPDWPTAVLMYGCMAVAVLAKGPVGLVMPTAVIGMYLLIQRLTPREVNVSSGWGRRCVDWCIGWLRPFEPRHFARTCWLMRPLTALGVVLVVALPWYVAVGLRTDGQWVRGFLLDHNLGRAAQTLEGHSGSLLFYPVALLIGFFPWSVFAAPTLFETAHRMRRRDGASASCVLAACWIGVYVGLFSLAKTKLPSYITPCYPAVAMLVAQFVCAWMAGRALSARYWPCAALICLAFVATGMIVAIALAAARHLPGEQWLAVLGLIPLLTAVTAYVFAKQDAPGRAAVSFGVGAILLTTSLFALGAYRVDRHQTFDTFVTVVHERSANPQVGTLGVLEPSWVFYTRQPMDHLFAPELMPDMPANQTQLGPSRTKDWQTKPYLHAWKYLAANPNRFVITTARHVQQIGKLPDHVVVLARTPYFLQDEELVLLGSVTPDKTARRDLLAR